jgi:ABC-type polysaccharide/polyol phosphate transport system ATPase subunit
MAKLVVEGLGKRYRLQQERERTGPLEWARTLRSRLRGTAPEAAGKVRDFWALKDVSFTVEPGTVLGVIGANGAGKTTLLTILARVITPTEGRVIGSGRVVSLLELGAGFDPDLTARDNILLNAAMLGVPRSVVMRRFDQIIDFAETQQFVETPLKHYSSGMYLRLAFSVAINMEPSILLADEILAVGDQKFQDRCLERVKQEAAKGLTVLFVSHDMESIVRVCNRTLWLDGGQVRALGDSEEVVAEYQNSVMARGPVGSERGRHACRFGVLHDVRVMTPDGREVRGVPTDQPAHVRMRFETLENNLYARVTYDVRSRGQLLFRTSQGKYKLFREAGMWEATMRLPGFFFNETSYSIVPSLQVTRPGENPQQPREKGAFTLMGEPVSFIVYGTQEGATAAMARADNGARRPGFLAPSFKFSFERAAQAAAPAEADAAGA